MKVRTILFSVFNWLCSIGFPLGSVIWLGVSGLQQTDPRIKFPATALVVLAVLLLLVVKFCDAKLGDYRSVTNTMRAEAKIEPEGTERYVKSHKELKKRDAFIAACDRVKIVLIACVFLLFAIVMQGVANDIANVITALGYSVLGLVAGGVFEAMSIAARHTIKEGKDGAKAGKR